MRYFIAVETLRHKVAKQGSVSKIVRLKPTTVVTALNSP